MKKPSSLRDHLIAAVPELRKNPDRLLIFVDKGSMHSTSADGLSFQYQYTLNLIITDFSGDPAAISIPLFAWVLRHQSELMTNTDNVKKGITFEADVLANDKVDLSISLPLSERVIVKKVDGRLEVSYPPEPELTPHFDETDVEVYADGQLLVAWRSAPPTGVDIETPHVQRTGWHCHD